MPFVPVIDVVQAEMRMTKDAQQVENTLHFYSGAAITTASLATLASALENWWRTYYAPRVATTVQLIEIFLRDLTTATSLQHTRTPGTPALGTKIGTEEPNNVSFCVSFRTSQSGRSYRGRNYVVGLVEADVEGSFLTSAEAANWVAAYEEMIDNVVIPDPWNWVIASKFSGVTAEGEPIPRAVGVAAQVVECTFADTAIDSMRRRLPNRGK